ncbi:hypothetical protein BN1708_003289, partial [Verticillium longisporum]
MMACPTGCEAPVTTQTKPYWILLSKFLKNGVPMSVKPSAPLSSKGGQHASGAAGKPGLRRSSPEAVSTMGSETP